MQEHIIAWHIALWSQIGQSFLVSILIAKFFDHADYFFGTIMVGFLAAFFLEPMVMELVVSFTKPEEVEVITKLDEPVVKSPILNLIKTMLMRGVLSTFAIIAYLFVRPVFDGLFLRLFEDRVDTGESVSQGPKDMGSRIDRFVN